MLVARFRIGVFAGLLTLGLACADGETGSGDLPPDVPATTAAQPMQGTQAPSMPPAVPGSEGAAASPAQPAPGSAGSGSMDMPAPAGDDGPADPATSAGDDTIVPEPEPTTPSAPAGPEDGDPSAPIVEVPGVPCGENPSLLGLTETNHTIGGRQVHVAYPCNKRAGAPMIFVLNLHGTMPDETLKGYQVAYFSINNHANSHNIISVAPKSVVAQWGNGDGGVDLPHLMEVIEWVYGAFADFDIRAMWVAGHSWGAMYSSTFVCDPMVADKVRGVVLMSGSPVAPACASALSLISTIAENDLVPTPVDQGTIPMGHGCGAAVESMIGNNLETHWPDCDPGFVHANYFMYGKAHADYIDAAVVERIADLMLEARP